MKTYSTSQIVSKALYVLQVIIKPAQYAYLGEQKAAESYKLLQQTCCLTINTFNEESFI